MTRDEGQGDDWGQTSLGLKGLPTPSFSPWEASPGLQAKNALSGPGFWNDHSDISVEKGFEKETLRLTLCLRTEAGTTARTVTTGGDRGLWTISEVLPTCKLKGSTLHDGRDDATFSCQ